MTTNKLADTFLLDLENLSDDEDEVKKVPERSESKEMKQDYMAKKKPAAVSTSSSKILDSASAQLINNMDYIKFKNSLFQDENNNNHIIPSSLTKDDKMYVLH